MTSKRHQFSRAFIDSFEPEHRAGVEPGLEPEPGLGGGGGRPRVDRRRFLGLAAGAAGAALFSTMGTAGVASASTVRRAAAVTPAGSDLGAIEHVIFLMMENRSFDHYFGTYPGVRGFDHHPPGSFGLFAQPDPDNKNHPPRGFQLPFHLNTVGTDNAECTYDLTHDWVPQHECWHNGAMDRFVKVHTSTANEGPKQGYLTMGYYTRQDLPYYYALADAFTICDGYHCSVMGPTDPNRLVQMSGTIDPAGQNGGPVVITSGSSDVMWTCDWETMPEVLQDAGISWKYYRPTGSLYSIEEMSNINLGLTYDTVLPYFKQYQSPTSALYQRAFDQTFPGTFRSDVKAHKLPAVSWISTPIGYDEHPPAPPSLGMWFTDQVLQILLSEPEVWSKTVLFHMYDENDGFFDHVAPPTAPPGTAGEYLTSATTAAGEGDVRGPIGLGFRVPMLVVSPFSRGGYICSNTFDHTSQLRFLEERFGVTAPNISAWRRATVGDLTATLRFDSQDNSVPKLPATSDDAAKVAAGCTPEDLIELGGTMAPYPLPARQHMPKQEVATRRHLG